MRNTMSVIATFFFCLVISVGILSIIVSSAKDKACIKIGYERMITYDSSPSVCEDEYGNKYYVDWNYETFPHRISAKEITVGNVRIK